jgi:hypothetical protein
MGRLAAVASPRFVAVTVITSISSASAGTFVASWACTVAATSNAARPEECRVFEIVLFIMCSAGGR